MKLILTLPYERPALTKKFNFITIKKNLTIIKNDKLLANEQFIEKSLQEGGKFLIETWERFDSDVANIVCGENGGKLRPVHIATNKKDYKALFQVDYCHIINISYKNELINIYKNYIDNGKLVGEKIEKINLIDYFNGNYKNKQFEKVISKVLICFGDTAFSYDEPIWAYSIDN